MGRAVINVVEEIPDAVACDNCGSRVFVVTRRGREVLMDAEPSSYGTRVRYDTVLGDYHIYGEYIPKRDGNNPMPEGFTLFRTHNCTLHSTIKTLDLDNPRFARWSDLGRVHVLRNELHTMHHTVGHTLPSVKKPLEKPPLVNMDVFYLLGRQWALCGSMGGMGTQHGVSEFDDQDLCQGCYRRWPGDKAKLFEHAKENPDA